MALNQGTVTIATYRASMPVGGLNKEHAQGALRKFAFKPINEDRGEKVSGGWVSYRDMLNADVSLEGSTIAPYVFLSLRIDRKKIAPNVLKATIRRKVLELSRERGGRPVSKNEKAALLEQVSADLLRAATAIPKTFDAVWNTSDGTVYFAASSRSACGAFEQLFADTFELSLTPEGLLARSEKVMKTIGSGVDLGELSTSWWGTSQSLAATPEEGE